eukprot:TRINITY_DN20803_c0_g1_i1.p1 TRINITY_DN20803_c0_g1~~TRINITY_DN20803_c0_g1_i1.p1  ORF type:complete len:269 (-),score=-3.12 TRINITY_DN20803_c0_g1_i1:55-861(-)
MTRHRNVMQCPLALLDAYTVTRHQLLGQPLPDFENNDWSKFPLIEGSTPGSKVSTDMISAWRVGIRSRTGIQLTDSNNMRHRAAVENMMRGNTRSGTAVLGGWRDKQNQVFSEYYATAVGAQEIATMAGTPRIMHRLIFKAVWRTSWKHYMMQMCLSTQKNWQNLFGPPIFRLLQKAGTISLVVQHCTRFTVNSHPQQPILNTQIKTQKHIPQLEEVCNFATKIINSLEIRLHAKQQHRLHGQTTTTSTLQRSARKTTTDKLKRRVIG